MDAITQLITQQLSGTAVRTISQRFGLSETTANAAVQLAVPMIVAALARNAAQPQGAENLHQAINKDHHDGSIFGNLMDYLGNPQSANGAGILRHVFGGERPAIETNLAQATGMDQGSASGLLETIAPLVMGAVGQAQHDKELDAPGLSHLLAEQRQQVAAESPDLLGTLGSLLDQNKDGSAMDDLQRMAARFLK